MKKVKILHTLACPNLAPLLTALTEISNSIEALEVEVVLVTTEDEAVKFGFHGSPTVIIDGRDPFAFIEASYGLSCRIYRDPFDPAQRIVGSPTKEMLLDALN